MSYKFTFSNKERYNQFFADDLSKSQKTKIKILEGAIDSYFENGIEKTTFASIAKMSNVSRPLVIHYYKSLDEVFKNSIELVSVSYLKTIIDTAPSSESAKVHLKGFMNTFITWSQDNPKHVKVMMLSFFKSISSDESRKVNSEFMSLGLEKLIGLIRYGKKTGEFHCDSPTIAAYEILTEQLGLLLLMSGTNLLDGKKYENRAFKSSLRIVDYQS